MPPKTSTITDVAGPGKTAPSATSRPLLVESRSVIPSDPMLVGATAADAPAASISSAHRSEKILEPVSGDVQAAETAPGGANTDEVQALPTPENAVKIPATDTPLEQAIVSPAAPVDAPKPKPAEPKPKPESKPAESPAASSVRTFESSSGDTEETDGDAHSDAAAAAATAAEEARTQELEKLVESGAYVVPINAVQHHRTHMLEVLMVVFVLILAVVLFDAALDSGVLHLSVNIPHTHLLSTH